MAYVYRGATDKCGTNRGYGQHLRDGEPACTRCLIAHRTDTQERRQAQPGYRTYRKAKCGTPGGALSHYRKGEKPCPHCKDALNASRRENRAKKKATTT